MCHLKYLKYINFDLDVSQFVFKNQNFILFYLQYNEVSNRLKIFRIYFYPRLIINRRSLNNRLDYIVLVIFILI